MIWIKETFHQGVFSDYYGIETYPKSECIAIRMVKDEWGLLSNFASTPLAVDGVTFGSSEELFQLMRFKGKDVIGRIRAGITMGGKTCHQIKMTAKSYEKTFSRHGMGQLILDAMKFCLTVKYDQCPEFRNMLQKSAGKHIVEDQTSMPKNTPDAWGVKADENKYVGLNLLGRLLMELRDNGFLRYHLPDDALTFISTIKGIVRHS